MAAQILGMAGLFSATTMITVLLLGQGCFCASLDSGLPYLKTFRIEVEDVTENKATKTNSDGKSSLPVASQGINKPDFCHELDCPAFKVINTSKSYEERLYVATRWVSTHMEGVDYDAATRPMFMKLFDYIEGNNEKKQKIAMTAPVLVSVIPGPGPACSSNFTMSFFLVPSPTDPPAPTDKTVFTSALPRQKVFVRSFGGFAFESSWLKNAEALAKSLVQAKQGFHQDLFYTAGYDSPFKILGRHNEVWYVAE